MTLLSFFSKKSCRTCHQDFRGKTNMCNNCIETAEEIIFQKEKYGIETRSGIPLLDLFCRQVLQNRN